MGNVSVSISGGGVAEAEIEEPAIEESEEEENDLPNLHPALLRTGNKAVDRLVDAMRSGKEKDLMDCLDPNFHFFHPALEMDREGYVTAFLKGVLAAFPDLHYNFVTIDDDQNGEIRLVSYFTGTHTGAPFGPPQQDKVPATGEFVVTGQEPWKCEYEGDIIKNITILADLPSCGPGGMYSYIAASFIEPATSVGIDAIDKYLESMHSGTPQDFLQSLSSDFQFVHPSVGVLNRGEYAGLMFNVLRKSFPDLRVNIVKLEEIEDDSEAVKIVSYLSGTHTGAAFGPPGQEQVEATGIVAHSEQESYRMEFDANVVKKIIVEHEIPSGGPQGLYISIGGHLPQPKSIDDLKSGAEKWKTLKQMVSGDNSVEEE